MLKKRSVMEAGRSARSDCGALPSKYRPDRRRESRSAPASAAPSGKEVDRYNVDVMMDILKRDFSDHQIIIASIFEYDFPIIKKIEIGDRLICNLINDGIYNPDKIN